MGVLIRSRRKTVVLIITKNAELEIRAPYHTPLDIIEKFVIKKSAWIARKKDLVAKRRILSNDEIAQYKTRAFEIIINRVNYYANLTGLTYKDIKITNAEKLWGSCSYSGVIRISWRLILAPQEALDYVVVHELMHLIERNHSKRFWNRVQEILPNYKELRKQLRQL